MFLCVFLLLGFARRDIEWGSRRSQRLRKEVHPHQQSALIQQPEASQESEIQPEAVEKMLRTVESGYAVPVLCQAAGDCKVVWFPHVQVPAPFSSIYEGTIAP